MLENIPRELRERASFVVWNYVQQPGKDKPTKPPLNAKTGWPASVTKPSDWATFDVAYAAYMRANGSLDGIGYVIHEDDPFTFIDLDTYDPKLTEDDRKRHQLIANTFKGYAEISPSGKGLHLIVKGKVPSGRKRGGVEIYSSGRYMTLTGNVWRNEPIIEQQALLQQLWAELGDNANEVTQAQDKPQQDDDETICNRARNAVNGDRFAALYMGQWQSSYASQSEADFALIDILGFYSENSEQIKRIFRASALGQRDKAKRDDYLNKMIARSQDNKPPSIDLEKLKANLNAQIAQSREVPTHSEQEPGGAPSASNSAAVGPSVDSEVYSLPPGLLGEIAEYVFTTAPRPVREIALVAAMGLMAGICGRAYNVSGTGLNQYLLLLTATGNGKEAIANGISLLMSQVTKAVPAASDFIGPADFRSDVALLKHLNKTPSIVCVVGEYGHELAAMADPRAMHKRAIKRVMLDLYGKSGQGATMRQLTYSDSDKNTHVIRSPAFSMIGESAPESFYDSVDERLISDGLLPRFTLIEYHGKRPSLNAFANHLPPEKLVRDVAALCAQALQLNHAGHAINVGFDPAAKELLDAFDTQCTDLINGEDSREVIRHIWNRAHLRALKLAGLVAVGVNPFQPVVTLACAEWAIRLASHNTAILLRRFESGEIGAISTDDKHMAEVKRNVKRYLLEPYKFYNNHPPSFQQMHADRVLPFVWLQNKVISLAAFRNDKRGPKLALKTAIDMLVDAGTLIQMSKQVVHEKYAFSGVVYMIPHFNAL